MPKIYLNRAITVNLDAGEQVKLLAGGNDVTDEVAGHWFVKANEVKEPDAEIIDASQGEVIEALQLSLDKANEQIAQLTGNLKNAGESIAKLQAENLDLRAAKSQRESELEAQVAKLRLAAQSVPDHTASTVDQIKALLTEKGIPFNSRDTKSELIALLG